MLVKSLASRRRAKRTNAHRFGMMAAAAMAAFSFSVTAPTQAETFNLIVGNGFVRVPIQNIKERRFATIIRQQYDFSCGSAAVATLLTYHYDRGTSEQDAFTAMWSIGNKQRISRLGFSLAEMKVYLEKLGYRVDGFRLTLDRVAEIGVPGIALININGYKHFVVVKGINDRMVLYGDPAAGVKAVSRKEFDKFWNDGIFFLLRSDVEQGKNNFNKQADWSLAPSGPLAAANGIVLEQSLAGEVLDTNQAPFRGTFIQETAVTDVIGFGN